MRRRIQLSLSGMLCCLAALAMGAAANAAPQVPDVYVYDVGYNGGNVHDFHYYGQSSGIAAYSMASQSCNGGTAPVSWRDSGGQTTHPVIGQNIFRLKDGRFEQMGYSWLKHGFCAVDESETLCNCSGPDGNCDWLAVGCADTYWATLNDGGSGRSKRWVNATSGTHVESGPSPAGNATIRGRIQVPVADIDPTLNPGAVYFGEIHYITADDHAAGMADNNASYRRLNVLAVSNIDGSGGTVRELPAIYGWKDVDPNVQIVQVLNTEAGGKGIYWLGFRVTNTAPGVWHYEYALHNFTSDQSAGAFSVPAEPGVIVSNIGFHDVNAHSGDPWSTTDWSGAEVGSEIQWATTPFGTDPNANALRWGTLYNFRFDANTPPETGTITIGLFKPGVSTEVDVEGILVPSDPVPFDKKALGGPVAPADGGVAPMVVGRNGSMLNPKVLLELSPAVIGQSWRTSIQMSEVHQSVLLIGFGGPSEGSITKLGELLIRPPFITHRGANEHVVTIPDDAALVGVKFSTQAIALTEDGWRLTNALDVKVGSTTQ